MFRPCRVLMGCEDVSQSQVIITATVITTVVIKAPATPREIKPEPTSCHFTESHRTRSLSPPRTSASSANMDPEEGKTFYTSIDVRKHCDLSGAGSDPASGLLCCLGPRRFQSAQVCCISPNLHYNQPGSESSVN